MKKILFILFSLLLNVLTVAQNQNSTDKIQEVDGIMAAPANNKCSNAISLGTVSTTTTTTGTNVSATADGTYGNCHAPTENVWYTFTVPAGGGAYSITVSGGTITYPCVSILSGSCASLTEVDCIYGDNSTTNTLNECTLAAGTYYLAVDDDYGSTGTFSITVTKTGAGGGPSNDNCSNAISLGTVSTSTVVVGTNVCATADGTYSGCHAPTDNVWYSFTVPSGGGTYSVNVKPITMTYASLSIDVGTCGSQTEYTCAYYSAGAASAAKVNGLCLGAGTYYVAVDDDYGTEGTFSLTVVQTAAGCSGTPTAGTTTASATSSSCGTYTTVLGLNGASTSCGISYQWQQSTNSGTTWANISGATLSNYTATVAANTCYRCQLSCTGTATSTSICCTSANTYTCNLNYSYSTITNSQDAGVSTSINGLTDDYLSDAIPIGFTFCFDSYMYTQAYVATNAALVFDAVDPTCAPNVGQSRTAAGNGIWTGYSINATIPTTTDYTPQNAILFPWHDLDIGNGGTIKYAVLGSAPSRRFVVSFNSVKQFETSSPCQNTSYDFTGQLKLYETSNIIEMHIQNMASCTSWNGGYSILGLHNAFGTYAVVPTGYNYPNINNISNSAWRFTSNCTSCMAILPIDMLSFEVSVNDEISNNIKFVTAKEVNVNQFHLERSIDGKRFEVISMISPKGTNGAVYEYSDLIPTQDTYYYRIGTEDKNGQMQYSGIRLAQRGKVQKTAVLNVYPTLFTESFIINIESVGNNNANIEVFDGQGRKIYNEKRQMKDGSNDFEIKIDNASSGLLLLKVSDDSGLLMYTSKIIKQQ